MSRLENIQALYQEIAGSYDIAESLREPSDYELVELATHLEHLRMNAVQEVVYGHLTVEMAGRFQAIVSAEQAEIVKSERTEVAG